MPYSSYCQVSSFDFGINFGLNETKCKIVELMIANPEIITEQIAEAIGYHKAQIEANISKLKALGIVERIGARKKGPGRQAEEKKWLRGNWCGKRRVVLSSEINFTKAVKS